MLSDEEKHEIEQSIAMYPRRPTGCVEAMKVVQRHRGWVSDSSIADLAEYLGMADTELEAIATFYNYIFRKPVGRHLIVLCDSISCWITGYAGLRQYLQDTLGIGIGETTADLRFTLLAGACLGACDGAPAMMIDDQLYENVHPGGVDDILRRYE